MGKNKKTSAGILVYRSSGEGVQVFLVHPGGPLWAKKDGGAWSIPKGEFSDEEPLAAAIREFQEETGLPIDGEFRALAPVTLKSGKTVFAWAVEGDLDTSLVRSNTFELEWPPRSGKLVATPEVDRGEWFSLAEALDKLNPRQASFIYELADILGIEVTK